MGIFLSFALLLLLLAIASCAGPSTPSDIGMPVPAPPLFAPPVLPTTTMRVEGQVFDADNQAPVAAAAVTATFLRVDGQWRLPDPGQVGTAITDHTGRFVLEEIIRGRAWEDAGLRVTRDGYEPVHAAATPASTDVVVRLYPTLTIRPGESIDARLLDLDAYATPWDGVIARRVVIEAAPGEPIQVDLTPLDHPSIGLTTLSAFQAPGDGAFPQHRMIVSTGAVWITGISGWPGRVRLTASRP